MIEPKPAPATLAVSNVTDYSWRLTIRNTAAGDVRNVVVPPRGACSVELAGGDYEIEQAAEATALTRRISCQLAAGQTYEWRLATLLAPGATDTP